MTIRLRWHNLLMVSLVVLMPAFANAQVGHSLAARPAVGITGRSQSFRSRQALVPLSSPSTSSRWCDWVQDCTFLTYQPGANGIWYPNKGGSGNTYIGGQ